MAARVLAQVVVAGATVLFRAATQAWAQALVNAQKSGVAQEAAQAAGAKIGSAAAKVGQMTVQEAQMILGVDANASWGELVKRYKHLYEQNEKHGSFYLLSKVYRARERLEVEYEKAGLKDAAAEEQAASSAQPDEQKK